MNVVTTQAYGMYRSQYEYVHKFIICLRVYRIHGFDVASDGVQVLHVVVSIDDVEALSTFDDMACV